MDHRISKDMISSGMIPSGEKKQEDLSRTQYGTAPSPNALSDVYKKMYETKEEVINEMAGKGMGMTPAPKPGGIAKPKPPLPTPVEKGSSSPTPKTDSRMDQVKKQGFAKSYRQVGPKSETEDMLDKVKDRQVEKAVNRDKDVRRARASYIMTKYGESVDLLAAYRSVYEHHKKDADGNTIPHEGEELNEAGFLAPLAGLFGKGAAGAAAGKAAAGAAAGKAAAGAAAGKAAAGTAAKVTTTGGKVVSGGAPKLGMMGKVKKFVKDNPVQSYYMAKDLTSGGSGTTPVKKTSTMSASADLFDIVKGQLLDEGLSEEEITDIMLTLTPDEIMSEMAVNPNIAAMDAKNKADMIARAQANKVPDKVKEASKRQMKAGTPREDKSNPYTTQDKKTIIDYNKDK